MKWEFRTFEHDIRFGIRCKNNKTDETIDEVPLKRVASHQLNEIGFIPCQPNCTCKFILVTISIWVIVNLFFSPDTVCFDNSYSYFKNKKIQYAVTLTPPMNDTEKLVEESTTDITADFEAIAALAEE